MPFVPVPGCARVTLDFISASGDDAANVFHVQDDDELFATYARCLVCANVIETWATTWWDAIASSAWSLDLITVRAMNMEEDVVATKVSAATGAVVQDALPSQVTLAISFRTGMTGRSNMGRLFHVGLRQNQTSGSYLDPGEVTAIIECYIELRDALAAAQFQLVIASFQEDGILKDPATVRAVTDIILTDTILDSQDRRTPKPL